MLKTGGIAPIATKLFIRLNSAKKITTRPAVLKNKPERVLVWTAKELKLKNESTGRVPSANTNIIIAPAQKFSVVSV